MFSSSRTSPSFSLSAIAGEWSSQNPTGRPMALARCATMGFRDIDGTTLPLGRSKWESTITRAPFWASSRMVGAWRSMRSVSVT